MAKADLDRAKELYPSTTSMGYQEWREFFDTPEGFTAMGQIIYDIYDEVLTQAEREGGSRAMGRRPARDAVSIDEVFDVVFPQPYTMDPFPEAMIKLLAGRSQRAFAPKIPCNHATLSRLIDGQLTPDLPMLERIAAAAKVAPSYFIEWRAHWLGQLVTTHLLARPNVSITTLEQLTKLRDRRLRRA